MMSGRWGFTLAVPLGLLLAPLVVVLSVYSFWSVLVLLAFAASVGAIVARPDRTLPRATVFGAGGGVAVALVAFAAVGILFARSASGIVVMIIFAWWWLALAAATGATAGILAGARPTLGVGLLGAAGLLFAGGWVAAFALTPTSLLTGDPCREGGMSPGCQLYVMCLETAERRRIGTIERVTEFNLTPPRIRCEYYTWGGIMIGAVEGDGRESYWTDGR